VKAKKPKREDGHYIYRSSITLRNGRRIFASWYGLKAFRIWIADK